MTGGLSVNAKYSKDPKMLTKQNQRGKENIVHSDPITRSIQIYYTIAANDVRGFGIEKSEQHESNGILAAYTR